MFANCNKGGGAQCSCCPECSCWIRRRESRTIEGSYLEPKQMFQKAIEGSFLERKENTAERHDFEIPCLRCRCKQGIAVLCDHCQAHMAIKKKLNNFTSESRQITQAWTEPKTVHPKLVTRVTTDVSKVFILPQSKTKIDRYSPKEKNFALEPSEKSIPCDNLERPVSSKEKSHDLIQQKPTLLHPGEPEKTVEFPSDDSIITSFLTSFPPLDKKKDFEFVFPKGKKIKQFNIPVSSSELIADVLKKKRVEMYERKDKIKAKDDEVYFSKTQARRERGDYSATTDDKREKDYPPETQPKEERGILPAIHAKEERGHPPYLESRVPSREETKQSRGERKLPPATHTREESSHPSEKKSQLQGPKEKLVKQDEKDIKDKKQTPEKQPKEQKGLPFQPADKSNRKLSIPPPARLPRPLATKEKEPSQKTTRKDGEIIKESNVKERIDQPQDMKRKVKQEEKSTNVKKQPFEKQVKEDKGITQQTEGKVKQKDIGTNDKKLPPEKQVKEENKLSAQPFSKSQKKLSPPLPPARPPVPSATMDKENTTIKDGEKMKDKKGKEGTQETKQKVEKEQKGTKDAKKTPEIQTKEVPLPPSLKHDTFTEKTTVKKDGPSTVVVAETKKSEEKPQQTKEKVKQEEKVKITKEEKAEPSGKSEKKLPPSPSLKHDTFTEKTTVKKDGPSTVVVAETKKSEEKPQQTKEKVKQKEKVKNETPEKITKHEKAQTSEKPEKKLPSPSPPKNDTFTETITVQNDGPYKRVVVAEVQKSEKKPQETKEKVKQVEKDKKKTPEKITKQEKAQTSEKPEKMLPPPPPPKNDIFTEKKTLQKNGPPDVEVAISKDQSKKEETKKVAKIEIVRPDVVMYDTTLTQKPKKEIRKSEEKLQETKEIKLPPPPPPINDIFKEKKTVQKNGPPDVEVAISKDQSKKKEEKVAKIEIVRPDVVMYDITLPQKPKKEIRKSEEKLQETKEIKLPPPPPPINDIFKEKKTVQKNGPPDVEVAISKDQSKKKEEKVAKIEIVRPDVVMYDITLPQKPKKEIRKSQLEPLPELIVMLPNELELDPKTLQNTFEKKNLPTDNEFIKNDKIVENLPEHHEILEIQEPSTMIQMTHNFSEIDFVDEESEEEEQAGPPTGIHYALSDCSYIENGWTQLPVERVVRKMFVYRSRSAQPEFDWFKNNQEKGTMFYESGEKLAEIDDTGYGRWYYKNGRIALDYHQSEDEIGQKRVVVYSSGERYENGKHFPVTLLAMFDFIGNGIVFDHYGKIRLNYNQTEGVVHDQKIGPTSHWKWHSLNDPPRFQTVTMNTFSTEKDPNILKLGNFPSLDPEVQRKDDSDIIAVEFDNFVKEVANKQSQKFSPFQIRMKALKINDQFSLRILDQTRIYLYFRDGSTKMKMNLGLLLDSAEVIDTDIAEIGIIANSILHPNPPKTKSMLVLKQNYMEAKNINGERNWHDNQVRNPMPVSSVDRMLSAKSGAVRHMPYVCPHMVIPDISCVSEIVPNTIPACIDILAPDAQNCNI